MVSGAVMMQRRASRADLIRASLSRVVLAYGSGPQQVPPPLSHPQSHRATAQSSSWESILIANGYIYLYPPCLLT